ncbi:MAG: cysteine hydrolase family protein, partial [Chloroflexota bacterium]
MAKGYGWGLGTFGYEMVARVRRLKDAAHAASAQVIHVHSMRRPTDNLPEKSSMMAGTSGLEVIPELQPVDHDILIYKRSLSGFSHNDLDYTLRTMGVDTVLIAGASTDNTVLWTAADAHQNRYKVVVV